MKTLPGRLALLALITLPLLPAHAAVITQQASNTAGTNWNSNNTWMAGAHTPSLDNTYINPTGMDLRTPEANSSTFTGASLTLQGRLLTKSGSGDTTITISNLILDGGELRNTGPSGAGGANHTVTGALTVNPGNSTISPGAAASRNLRIESLISGSGGLTIGTSSVTLTNTVSFTNALNTFDGSIDIKYGILAFGYDFAPTQALSSLQINTSGKLNLSNDITVGSLTVDTTSFGPGVYTYSDFTTAGLGAYFVSGAGEITVVATAIPEPRVYLLGMFAAGLLFARHRSRRRLRLS